jgi:hypothetical protein
MGAWGGIIMSFFGAVFAAATLSHQLGATGLVLVAPFVGFTVIALAAATIIRLPGEGIQPSHAANRVIMWSSIGEGVGLFFAANLAVNLRHADLLLPATALVVGSHFLPMAYGIPFRPFYILGSVLLAAAMVGFVISQPAGGIIAGFAATMALWIASVLALRRDLRAKTI